MAVSIYDANGLVVEIIRDTPNIITDEKQIADLAAQGAIVQDVSTAEVQAEVTNG